MQSADLIVPDWSGMPAGVGALMTTRRGGVSGGPYGDGAGGGGLNLGSHVGDRPQDVQRNRELLQAMLPAQPAWLAQVHCADVVDAAPLNHGAPPVEADGSVSAAPGVVCAIQVADCLPVLFCDAAGGVVGAAHAGWRGLAAGVLENTVSRMRGAGADAEILAWLGPAIGPQKFEVGAEVREIFMARDAASNAAFVPVASREGKYLADIYLLARLALACAGVKRVSGGGLCTVSDPQRFYSFRRDGVTGRMAALVWIR
jgi:YfiH family protein